MMIKYISENSDIETIWTYLFFYQSKHL